MVNTGDELVAALGATRAELVHVEQEAAAAIGNARGEVAAARGRVDEFRLGLIEDVSSLGNVTLP